jgi:hypothetical protein
MKRREERPAMVRCAYLKVTWDNTTMACGGYHRSEDYIIRRRIACLRSQGYYDDREVNVP